MEFWRGAEEGNNESGDAGGVPEGEGLLFHFDGVLKAAGLAAAADLVDFRVLQSFGTGFRFRRCPGTLSLLHLLRSTFSRLAGLNQGRKQGRRWRPRGEPVLNTRYPFLGDAESKYK